MNEIKKIPSVNEILFFTFRWFYSQLRWARVISTAKSEMTNERTKKKMPKFFVKWILGVGDFFLFSIERISQQSTNDDNNDNCYSSW